jgi:hypothetical protein
MPKMRMTALTHVAGDASPSPTNVVYHFAGAAPRDDQPGFAAGLNDLDLIARFVLAIAHSGQWTAERVAEGTGRPAAEAARTAAREQHFVNQRTVAVARVRGTLYIAANMLWNDDVEDVGTTMTRVMLALRGEGIRGPFQFVPNPNGSSDSVFHAEMQLLRYLARNGLPMPAEMGVSKPCCPRCAARLDRIGVAHSAEHDQDPGPRRWEAP